MAKETKVICDRCGGEICFADDRVVDFLQREYPGKDICKECDLLIALATGINKQALVNNEKPSDLLRRMLENYD